MRLDVFRIRSSTHDAVQAVAPAVNGNADALMELQQAVTRLETVMEALRTELERTRDLGSKP